MNEIEIIQITDLHLNANKSHIAHNINPYNSAQIIIDEVVSNLIESTYRFDPPQEVLDKLDAEARQLLSRLLPTLDNITKGEI